METDWKIYISSGPLDKDYLVVEIYYQDEQLADLIENGEKIIIYNKLNGDSWKFNYNEIAEVLIRAKKALGSKEE